MQSHNVTDRTTTTTTTSRRSKNVQDGAKSSFETLINEIRTSLKKCTRETFFKYHNVKSNQATVGGSAVWSKAQADLRTKNGRVR